MATLVDARGTNTGLAIDTTRALRSVIVPRTTLNYAVSTITGTMAAALGANSAVFAMRLDPSAPRRAFIERVRLQWTTIVAFTTAVTAGRRIALFRGSGAAASGGTAIAAAPKKHTAIAASQFDTAEGGDVRIATTAALTVTGITFETEPLRVLSLSHVGTAGAHHESVWEFASTESAPILLEPGQVLALRNPVAMDAAGTWQLALSVDWHEATLLTETVD